MNILELYFIIIVMSTIEKNWISEIEGGKFSKLAPFFEELSKDDLRLFSKEEIISCVDSSMKAKAILFYRVIQRPEISNDEYMYNPKEIYSDIAPENALTVTSMSLHYSSNVQD